MNSIQLFFSMFSCAVFYDAASDPKGPYSMWIILFPQTVSLQHALSDGGVCWCVAERPVCPYCERAYSSPSNLRQHIRNVHMECSRDQWLHCNVCGKPCKTKHYLINHQLQAHGIRQRQQPFPFPEQPF